MKAVTGFNASVAIARLTAKRVLRSRLLIIGSVLMALSFLPTAFGAGRSQSPEFRWEHFLRLAGLLEVLVVSLLSASAIAEEIENKTYSYLWARPIPRWSVLSGKLWVAITIGIVLTSASAAIGYSLTGLSNSEFLLKAIFGLSLGALAVSSIASFLGTLAPKYALAVSIAYFLVFDSIVGAMPFAMARISVQHNVTAIAGFGSDSGGMLTSVLWLLGISFFALLLSVRRLSRKEFSTGS